MFFEFVGSYGMEIRLLDMKLLCFKVKASDHRSIVLDHAIKNDPTVGSGPN